ncbi:glycosyltransferase [Mycetocola spongiae]|uniref:glycosyltransferase n=1 Tax=Mycetocola spongiae TaxID=2859226 RepID=UPI001CF1FD21|nr:glycosyltransferase [Mycetocola spongiae]UCR90338.1 glycosyltransferase [Mycetocola spongiae]
MAEWRAGVVSVVLVNFRGTDDTIDAIRNLQALDWPRERLEIIVVENASGDDSLERLRREVDGISLIVSKENLGFAGGCNLGVARSHGEYVAFLNNDARPDGNWISAAISRFENSSKIGAVASRVLDWDGELVDFIGAALTWYGMGYKPLTAEPVPSVPDKAHDVLFGTGAAMFVRRSVFDELGGFDERYFMFFEDVDLGWRLNLAGHRFVYEPGSVAFHKHHASMSKFGSFKETYLLERNALFTLYKNLGEESLHENLAAALALNARRAVARGELDSQEFDLRRGGSDAESTEVAKSALATLYGVDQFVANLPSLRESRAQIQRDRVTGDGALWKLFGETDAPAFPGDYFHEGYSNIVDTFAVLDGPPTRKVLIITGDPIGVKMAGPAIRAWHMAEALAVENDVTLVSLASVEPLEAGFDIEHVAPGDERSMRALEATADVIIFQGLAMALFKCIRETRKILVCDIYDPMHLEHLEQGREHNNAEWTRQVSSATDVLNEQLERGDFFICASERQRHFYLGQLAALGRVNPANYEDDPDLTGLISVVPFGLSSVPPKHERPVLKGVWPGIGVDDKVLLWSGGLYNWFDPENLIRAVGKLAQTRPNVRLFFQGTKHPHPGVPEMAIVARSRALATELGILDVNVFFNSSWVDYADRQNYLTEADAGVSTHFSHIETTFSFRTRILDYLWADLPMVVTEGDHFAELVERRELGVSVPAEDVEALTEALERVLFNDDFAQKARKNVAEVASEYRWENVLAPLTDFVREAHFAEDRVAAGDARVGAPAAGGRSVRKRKHGISKDIELVAFYLKNGGPRVLVHKVRARLRRGRSK